VDEVTKQKIFIKVNPTINIKNDPWSDQDGDFWPNWKDCRPKNPKLQHVRPSQTTRKRLEKLPIFFVSGEPEIGKTRYYGVDRKTYTAKGVKKTKKVPKEIKKTQQRFYSVIKKRPEVVGEIERKKPGMIIISSRTGEKERGYATPTDELEIEDKQKGKGIVAVKLSSDRGKPYRREAIEDSAGTFIHELEHVRQQKAWKGKPKLQKKMKKGRYTKRKEEVLARKAEEKAEKKRYEHQSYPYEFSPKYEKTKERFKKEATSAEKQYYKRKQKTFFKGYRRMMDEEEDNEEE